VTQVSCKVASEMGFFPTRKLEWLINTSPIFYPLIQQLDFWSAHS